jgi:hypothetical protein
MEIHSITVLDRCGLHRAVYVPPASRQPKPTAPAAYGFDHAAIMRAAWTHYHLRRMGVFAAGDETGHRHFILSIFATALSISWAEAKKRADTERRLAAAIAEHVAIVAEISAPKFTGPAAVARIAAIENELRVIEYSDAWSIPTGARERHLRAELNGLRAAQRGAA